MSSDGVEHLLNGNSFNLFRLGSALNKHLGVQVIMVVTHIGLRVSKEFHNVDSLFDLLGWQMRGQHLHSKFFVSQHAHVLVRPKVMWRKGRHLIKDMSEVLLDLLAN